MSSRKREASKTKKINPVYYIFCEGETEDAYVSFLKQKFRVNIKIKSKITGQKISESLIKNYIKEISKGISSEDDKTFLMYDVDSEEIKNRLLSLKNSIRLFSNPNIELWFLLHFRNQRAYINSNNCIRDLKGFNSEYEKPKLNSNLERCLMNNIDNAINRAKQLSEYENPSTSVHLLIDEINKVKMGQT
jgi:hypothetical protein